MHRYNPKNLFDVTTLNKIRRFFSIFVAFSAYMNFILLVTPLNGNLPKTIKICNSFLLIVINTVLCSF